MSDRTRYLSMRAHVVDDDLEHTCETVELLIGCVRVAAIEGRLPLLDLPAMPPDVVRPLLGLERTLSAAYNDLPDRFEDAYRCMLWIAWAWGVSMQSARDEIDGRPAVPIEVPIIADNGVVLLAEAVQAHTDRMGVPA